jgi:hypothetical protein
MEEEAFCERLSKPVEKSGARACPTLRFREHIGGPVLHDEHFARYQRESDPPERYKDFPQRDTRMCALIVA